MSCIVPYVFKLQGVDNIKPSSTRHVLALSSMRTLLSGLSDLSGLIEEKIDRTDHPERGKQVWGPEATIFKSSEKSFISASILHTSLTDQVTIHEQDLTLCESSETPVRPRERY